MDTRHGDQVAETEALRSRLPIRPAVIGSSDAFGYTCGSEGDSESGSSVLEAAAEAAPNGAPWPHRRTRADLPPYVPVLCLSTKTYQLSGVSASDVVVNYAERLKAAVRCNTGRHLVGACVRLGPGGSCHVVLDMVDPLEATSSTGTGTSAMGAYPAMAGSRRLASGAGENRKPATNVGAASAGPRWFGDLPLDAELGVSNLRFALLLSPWWQNGAFFSWLFRDVWLQLAVVAAALLRLWGGIWMSCSGVVSSVTSRARASFRAVPWHRSVRRMGHGAAAAAVFLLRLWDAMWTDDRERFVRCSSKDTDGLGAVEDPHGASASMAAPVDRDDWGALGRVIGRRITAVGPRVLLVGQQAPRSGPSTTQHVHSQRPSPNGVGAGAGPGAAWAPYLQVTLSACCSGRPGGDSVQGKGARACCSQASDGGGGGGEDTAGSPDGGRHDGRVGPERRGRGPGLQVLLRHGHGFGSTCSAHVDRQAPDQEAAAAGGAGSLPASAAPRACRRALCRMHLTLRQDVKPAECRNESAPSSGGSPGQPIQAELGPGLLLMDVLAPAPAQPNSVQPPVPVLLLDDPRVVEELQPVLADRQVSSCSAANLDDLLVDMGVFLQHLGALRRVAAPVLAFVESGALRRGGRTPPCCCRRDPQHRGGGNPQAAPLAAGCSVVATTGTPEHAPVSGPCASDPWDARTAPCVACQVQRLHDFADAGLSSSTFTRVGECLLRHATSAGWVLTASYISSCLSDLQRISVLIETLEAQTSESNKAAAKTGDAGERAVSCDGGCGRGHPAAADASAWAAGLALWRSAKPLLVRLLSPVGMVLPLGRLFPASVPASASPISPQPWWLHPGAEFSGQSLPALLRRVDIAGSVARVMVAVGSHLLYTALLHALAGLAVRFGVGPLRWLDSLPCMALSAALAFVTANVLPELAGTGGCAGGSGRKGASVRARTGGWRVRS